MIFAVHFILILKQTFLRTIVLEIPILKSNILCIVEISYDLNHDLRPKLSPMRSSKFDVEIYRKESLKNYNGIDSDINI